MGNKNAKNKKDPTVLLDEEVKFLLANTRYSKEEIMKWHAGFLVSFHSSPPLRTRVDYLFWIHFNMIERLSERWTRQETVYTGVQGVLSARKGGSLLRTNIQCVWRGSLWQNWFCWIPSRHIHFNAWWRQAKASSGLQPLRHQPQR